MAPPSLPGEKSKPPRLLFVDAYDSFSNNIIALLKKDLSAHVHVVRIDDPVYNTDDVTPLIRLLEHFDGVIVGPGPGHPSVKQDIGLIGKLWALEDQQLIPILGICLGFQSLCLAFGASILRLNEPRHGIVSEILHNDTSLFQGVKSIAATNYHSLHVYIGHSIQEKDRCVSYPSDLWVPTASCPLLAPLAWDFDSVTNGAVLMGVKHAEKPFWGVQYHPESICTNREGSKIVSNWWTEARKWHAGQVSSNAAPSRPLGDGDDQVLPDERGDLKADGTSSSPAGDMESIFAAADVFDALIDGDASTLRGSYGILEPLGVIDICRLLRIPEGEVILFESKLSAPHHFPTETAHYSIIGFVDSHETVRLHYHEQDQRLEYRKGIDNVVYSASVANIWPLLSRIMEKRKTSSGTSSVPFWGGFMGYVSYEASLPSTGVSPPEPLRQPPRPGICFAWVSRSIVVDHHTGYFYVQSTLPDDQPWIADTMDKINAPLRDPRIPLEFFTSCPPPAAMIYGSPEEYHALPPTWHGERECDTIVTNLLSASCRVSPFGLEYAGKVRKCQEEIRAGNSYELCLTSQTSIEFPNSPPEFCLSWHLYRRLCVINPAPFQVFMRLGLLHLIGSSPERFLRWNRKGSCEYRPIKGTVKKGPDVSPWDAVAMLNTSKERAENLMIVDLIRHDLHGVVGAENVQMSSLMAVEEYASVYQLVSVIEGRLKENQSGIDVLGASLPPGSMTGAPKRRSCEILKEIEGNKPRGIYSGVIGYLDIGGGGDFSVVIRTAYRWEDEIAQYPLSDGRVIDQQTWYIGAGGAVTAQSTTVGEYAEMETKLESIARVFDPVALHPDEVISPSVFGYPPLMHFTRHPD